MFNLQALDQGAWKLVAMRLPGYKAKDVPWSQQRIQHRKWAKMLYGTHPFVWETRKFLAVGNPWNHYGLFLHGSLNVFITLLVVIFQSAQRDCPIHCWIIPFMVFFSFLQIVTLFNKTDLLRDYLSFHWRELIPNFWQGWTSSWRIGQYCAD